MSKEKFTQGEWVVDDKLSGDNETEEGHTCISAPDWMALAQVVTVFMGDKRTKNSRQGMANAHLISAAPDMYRALRELLEDSEAAYLDKDKTDAAYAALAKSEGKV